ncbi:hypothetical protein CQA72_26995 [Klebsiella pneumoniae]|nr:hypothetical protein CQA72_26995 [Klebsiella pneumoniae]
MQEITRRKKRISRRSFNDRQFCYPRSSIHPTEKTPATDALSALHIMYKPLPPSFFIAFLNAQ